ncbi:probable cytochrome P450 4aa1 [Periplaneta americana]|uniref:probable cytochrome P450 4aa1 n=1 Tax=Periplaneta americana TaxID=6978 RepID=UPI0037E715B1
MALIPPYNLYICVKYIQGQLLTSQVPRSTSRPHSNADWTSHWTLCQLCSGRKCCSVTAGMWSYCLAFLFSALCYYLSSWFRTAILALQLPGPPALPLLGNALLAINHKQMLEMGCTGFQRYGPVIRIWITVLPTVMLLEPEHIQVVLSSAKHTEKPFLYGKLSNFLGRGLVTNGGSVWKEHRHLLEPGMHLGALENFLKVFHAGATRLVVNMRACAGADVAVNVTRPVNECVLGILHEAVLGLAEMPQDSPFRQGKLVAPYRLLNPWLLVDWVYRVTDLAKTELHQQRRLFHFTQKVVRQKLSAGPLAGPQSLADFVTQLACGLSEESAVHELMTLMQAGQDTVGSALAFALLELARNPDVQERAALEVEAVLGGHDRAPRLEDLRRMRYLEQCVKETLRLYPSVPFVLRSLGEDTPLGKLTLPAGAYIMVTPFATHRLPHVYPDPERFDPDRFLPERCAQRHPFAFLPFSAGPRNCIGHRFAMLELKTVLSAVLRAFRLSAVPGRDTANLAYRVMLRAHGGVWVRLTPRLANRGEN